MSSELARLLLLAFAAYRRENPDGDADTFRDAVNDEIDLWKPPMLVRAVEPPALTAVDIEQARIAAAWAKHKAYVEMRAALREHNSLCRCGACTAMRADPCTCPACEAQRQSGDVRRSFA